MDADELLALLAALGHRQRLNVLAALTGERVHVSELARRLGLSRPLLYMHLEKLQAAGLVEGDLELSADGKAMKFFRLVPFDVRLTPEAVLEAMASSAAPGADAEVPPPEDDRDP
ncbi:MAG: winged helix-turn-helix domain-containing protein [Kineosporiaceae bacterium]